MKAVACSLTKVEVIHDRKDTDKLQFTL